MDPVIMQELARAESQQGARGGGTGRPSKPLGGGRGAGGVRGLAPGTRGHLTRPGLPASPPPDPVVRPLPSRRRRLPEKGLRAD